MSKYDKTLYNGTVIDVYDVLDAWEVKNPAVQHAIKKLLQPGERGHKTTLDDLHEAYQSIARAIDLETDRSEEVVNGDSVETLFGGRFL